MAKRASAACEDCGAMRGHLAHCRAELVRAVETRAEKAERALADAIAERDAYKRAKAENDERFMIERDTARRERDEARAERDEANTEVDDLCSAIGGAATPEGALSKWRRACERIAKLEAVVEAARKQWAWIDAHHREPRAVEDRYDRGYVAALDAVRHWFSEPLRALDEQDSGGSGAAQDGVLQKPEPAGSSRCGGCRGSGIIPGTSAYDTEQCRECHGTGLFCPSQLIAAHPVGEQPAYLTRAELVEALRGVHAAWCRDMGATRTQVGDLADAITGSGGKR